MNNKTFLVYLMFTSLLFGCKDKKTEGGDTVICTTSFDPALIIEVYDKQTGEAISCGSIATIQDGSFSETVENINNSDCSDQTALLGAYERTGNYDITVTKNDYVDWTVTNIEVTANVCHVNTIRLQAYLEK